jgi:hypothetical protein
VLFVAPGAAAVAVVFALTALADLALLVGFHTRIAQAIAMVLLVSLESRVRPLMNGGDRALCILGFWTLFLPMGARYSIDALRRPTRPRPAVSVAYLALVLQLAVAYFLNAVFKDSRQWSSGGALWFILHDASVSRAPGCFFADHASPAVLTGFTLASRAIEYLAPILILTPLYARPARWIAIVLLIGLHAGIAVTMSVGIFSYAMIAFYPLLLVEDDHEAIARATARLSARLARSSWGAGLAARWERLRAAAAAKPEAPAEGPRARTWTIARESIVVVFLVLAAHRVIVDNARAHLQAPEVLRAIIEAPHLYQRWQMFVGEHDEVRTVVVDAETIDGRHVDPLAEVGAPGAADPRPWKRVPACMDTDSFYQAYTAHFSRKPWALKPLAAWIRQYPSRTGRANDAIARFTVYEVFQPIVTPGQDVEPMPRFVELYDSATAGQP